MMYAASRTHKKSVVLTGTAEALVRYMADNEDIQHELDLIKVQPPLEFTSRVTYPKKPGKPSKDKLFDLIAGKKYAIYLKQGYEDVCTPTPLDLFLQDKEFIET